MPILEDDQLAKMIAGGTLNAITLDTSIFDRFGCNLGYRLLRSLRQFKGTAVALVFSEVVAGEVVDHIHKSAEKEAERLRSAINHYRIRWNRQETSEQLAALIDLTADPIVFAREQWKEFLADVGGAILVAEDNCELPSLLSLYFGGLPPFGHSEKKKSEFPDAISLLSLEAWAEKSNKSVLVISEDGDWRAFAAQSARLFHHKELSTVLDAFHGAVRFVAERIVSRLKADELSTLAASIRSAIETYLDDLDIEVEGETSFEYEAEPLSAALQSFTIDKPPLVISSTDDEITFSIEFNCRIAFEAEFSLFVHDSVDKDWVNMGSTHEEIEQIHPLLLVISCTKATEPEKFQVRDVEVAKRRLHVGFGHLDSKWADEN